MSQTLSDHVFLIFCGGIASIANENHELIFICSLWVSPTPIPARSVTHQRPFLFFGSKLEDNDPIMLGLIQLGADTLHVPDPDFRGAALGCWGWVAW